MKKHFIAAVLFLSALCLPVVANYASAGERLDVPGRAERSLSFYNTHTGEKLSVTYYQSGRYVPAALDQVSHHLRDHRRNEEIRIEPGLLDALTRIKAEINRRHPSLDVTFHVISGYRSPQTNEMLRQTSGGQARQSRHMHGNAIDIRVPGLSTTELRDIAWCLQQGGVGYYKGSDFVHVDTSRVRFWNWTPTARTCALSPNS